MMLDGKWRCVDLNDSGGHGGKCHGVTINGKLILM